MNYVGIDMSLSSTGLYIIKEDGEEIYYNYKSDDKLTKWHKVLSFVNYKSYKRAKSDVYSDSEVLKIISYNMITDTIMEDILKHVEPENTTIVTEGYSYSSSNTTSLIDLVAYASLLRAKVVEHKFYNFIVKSPSTLKVAACELSYGVPEPIIEYKKNGQPKKPKIIPCKNRFGIAGGRFKKHDMLDALLEKKDTNVRIKQALLPHHIHIQKMKNVPKPIDDLVDAVWLALSELESDREKINKMKKES